MKRLLVSLVICALIAIALGANWTRFAHESLNGIAPADFPNYYFAGRRLLNEMPIYTDLEEEVRTTLGWQYDVYPADTPLTVALLTPLALLPYQAAWWCLFLTSAALLSLSTFFTFRQHSNDTVFSIALALGSLLTIPALFLMKRNHMESLLVPLSLAGWVMISKRRYTVGMGIWGVAAALKLFPALWIVGCIGKIPPRSAIFGIIVAAMLSVLGALVVGGSNASDFVTQILPRSSDWYGKAGNLSLLSLGVALFGSAAGVLLEVAGAVACVLSLVKVKNISSVFWIQIVGWSLLLSPLGWINYWVLLIAPLVYLAFEKDFLEHRTAVFTWAFILLAWPTTIATENLYLSVILSHVPTLALATGLLLLALRSKRGAVI